jgi:hypothetical protein
MVGIGALGSKSRRADRVDMFFVATPATGNLQRDIIAFLNSDSRYNYRTEAAVRKVFASAGGAVSLALDEMKRTGLVSTKTRRRDRTTLFCATITDSFFEAPAAAPVEAVAAVVAAPELTVAAVREFVGGNPQYTCRSMDAITKNFAEFSADVVRAKVDEMVYDGDLGTLRRRSDGTTLYKLA